MVLILGDIAVGKEQVSADEREQEGRKERDLCTSDDGRAGNKERKRKK